MDGESEIAVKELKRLIDSGAQIHLIDVREQYEYDFCRIDGSRLMPISQIRNRVNELNPERVCLLLPCGGAKWMGGRFPPSTWIHESEKPERGHR